MSDEARGLIEERQNHPDMLRIQRAASRAHVSTQRWSRLRFYVAISFAVAGLVTETVPAVPGAVSDWVVFCGLVWTVLHLLWVTPQLNAANVKAALLQERFDTQLLNLPWNELLVGEPLRADEVQELTRRFGQLRSRVRSKREAMIADWYDVETEGVPQPYDALLCQRQSLAWDARLRRNWASVLAGSISVWIFVCLGVAAAVDLSVLDTLLRLIVPSLPAIQIAWTAAADHRRVATERERAARLVEDVLNAVRPGARAASREDECEFVRQVQDVLWMTRIKTARVPQWLYMRFREKFQEDFRALSRDFRGRLGLETDP